MILSNVAQSYHFEKKRKSKIARQIRIWQGACKNGSSPIALVVTLVSIVVCALYILIFRDAVLISNKAAYNNDKFIKFESACREVIERELKENSRYIDEMATPDTITIEEFKDVLSRYPETIKKISDAGKLRRVLQDFKIDPFRWILRLSKFDHAVSQS